jgi:deoxycytidylate deaminase
LGFDKNGNLLGTSVNKPRFDKYKGGTHAEMALIKRYSDNIKTILICRVNNQGDFLAIKPCSTCARVANKMGIKIKTISEKI